MYLGTDFSQFFTCSEYRRRCIKSYYEFINRTASWIGFRQGYGNADDPRTRWMESDQEEKAWNVY